MMYKLSVLLPFSFNSKLSLPEIVAKRVSTPNFPAFDIYLFIFISNKRRPGSEGQRKLLYSESDHWPFKSSTVENVSPCRGPSSVGMAGERGLSHCSLS